MTLELKDLGGSGGAGGSDGGSNGPGGSGGATGSVGVAGSSDEDNNSDSDDTSANDSSELDLEEHVPLPVIGIAHYPYGTNPTNSLQGLLNGIDALHDNRNTTNLLSLYAESQDQANYANSVDPSRSVPALNDIARNAEFVSNRCAEHIEDLTGIADVNEFDNLCNTVNDLMANGSTLDEANKAININNDND